MNRLINFMLRMPVEMLAGGVGLIAKAVEEFQGVFNETADLIAPPHSAVELVDVLDCPPHSLAEEAHYFQFDNSSQLIKEIEPMYEDSAHDSKDLCGDELKYVSYSIIFTKRDFEATLVPETEEIVDYDTDGGAFGGLKLSEFFQSLPRTVPREWQGARRGRPGPDDDYGYNAANGTYGQIPQEDRKYLRFVYSVKKRIEKSQAEYDRDKRDAQRDLARSQQDAVETLRQIRDRI